MNINTLQFDIKSPFPNTGYGVSANYYDFLTGDFNGDGKTDLIHFVNDQYAHTWISNGDGTFDIKSPFPNTGYGVSANNYRFLAGDFNGDGKTDLIHFVNDQYAHTWISNGDGTFDIKSPFPNTGYGVSANNYKFLTGDFNGDGKIDLIHFVDDKYARTWLSNGDGTFDIKSPFPNTGYGVGANNYKFLAGDFNGDGKTDLIHFVDDKYAHTWISNGNGTFDIKSPFPNTGYGVGANDYKFLTGDFNGDGKTDLIHFVDDKYARTWLSNGDGTFDIKSPFPNTGYGVGANNYKFLAGDFNGDGKTDLIHFVNDKYTHTWTSNGDGTFDIKSPFPNNGYGVGANDYKFLTGDFNGDGKTDLIHFVNDQYTHVWIAVNNTAPINIVPITQIINEDTQIAITGIGINDLDGNLASTKLTVVNGTLNVNIAGGATILTGANSSSTLTLTGTQAQINAALGTLKYQGNLNFNGADTLTVLSTDNSGTPLTDTDTVSLTINPINDAPTDISLSATSVNENVPINTAIGTFTTSDPDNNDSFTYSFIIGDGDNDNNSFSISGNQLKINSSPDFESKLNYSVRVRSTDAGGQFFDKVSTIAVNDLVNNNVIGTSGNDTLFATNEIDNIQALDGDDSIFATVANLQPSDIFDGGNGNDTFNLSGGLANQILTINLNSTNQFVSLVAPTISNVTLKNIENISLTGFLGNASLNGNAINNTIKGGSGNNTINGGLGNDFLIGDLGADSLIGGDGNDTLNGNEGNDTLNGGIGSDILAGGRGDDTYIVDSSGDAISEFSTLATEIDIVQASVNFTLGGNLENLILTGSQSINGTGNDLNNAVTGNGAANILDGGLGDDKLIGGLGNDTLIGGLGNDTLTGGVGTDTFILSKTGVDTIQDFAVSEKLLVSASAFGGLTAGVLASNKLLVDTGVTTAGTADQRFIFNNTDKSLYFDIDGVNGVAAVKIGVLTGFSDLTATNFSIVA
jgi:Ca2+-binding RTX toxin-like protein